MIMFNYKIIINFCYGCDIIITLLILRGIGIEPFLIEINDKSKLIYTKILILITWMDMFHSAGEILQNFSTTGRSNPT